MCDYTNWLGTLSPGQLDIELAKQTSICDMSHEELVTEKHEQNDRSARQDNLQMGFKILK